MVAEYAPTAYGEPVVPEEEYVERPALTEALTQLFGRASRGQVGSALIEGLRGVGKTDMVRRAIQRHLVAEPSTALVYYQVQPYLLELYEFTRSYFNTFVRQYRFSRHRDLRKLSECDDAWHSGSEKCGRCSEPILREICEALGRAYNQGDAANLLSLLVNMPHYLSELQGQRCMVVFDQARFLWQVHQQKKDVPLVRHLLANFDSAAAPHFLVDSTAALRTLLGEQALGERLTLFEVTRLDHYEALAMLQTLCDRLGVNLSVRLAEPMLSQLAGIPFYLHSLVRRAQLMNLALDSTDRLGQAYAQEIRDGTIHWYWRAQLSTQFPHALDRHRAVELVSFLAGLHPQRANLARLSQRLALQPPQLQMLITKLQLLGVLDRSFGTVGLTDDPVLRDLATVLAWGENSAISDSELLRRLAARRIRGASTPPVQEAIAEFIGRLEKLLQSFRGQYLPAEWFRYHDDYGAGWAGPEGIRRWLGTSDTLVRLPFLLNASRIDLPQAPVRPPGSQPTILIGSGYWGKEFTLGNETYWVVVVWPTADPIAVDLVHETARLRTLVEEQAGIPVRHVWLIGKATFTREARQLSAQLQFFTGNMDMADYIYDQMFAQGSPWREPAERAPDEPAMVVTGRQDTPAEPDAIELCLPAGTYPERIATETLEEIAQSAGLSLARIGQMKMAVLEAVINAAEACQDPADKIHVRYVILPDRLEVYVRTRQAHPRALPALEETDGAPQPPLKGWGLRMIYTLADEVMIRPLEDGTEIQMTCRREAAG